MTMDKCKHVQRGLKHIGKECLSVDKLLVLIH